jgi:hypothetical protein
MAAAILIVAAASGVGASAGPLEDALAQDWFWSPTPAYPPEKFRLPKASDKEKKNQERIRLLVSSGVDLWRHGAFAHDAMLWAPFGAGNDGLVFKVIASSGVYRYRAGSLGGAEVNGWMAGAAVMPGVQFMRHGVWASIYFGADMQAHVLSQFDPGNRLQGRHSGLRIAIDLWTEPTAQSMVAASATLSSIGGSYAFRGAAGWRLLDLAYVGPEVILYGDSDYRQVRVGMHATALRATVFGWRFEWQAGVGYAYDDDDNEGAYARLGLMWRH